MIASSAAFVVLGLLRIIDTGFFLALTGGGTAIAIVGYLDDRRGLPAKIRLAVHFAAALWAMAWLGGLPPLRVADQIISLGWAGYALGALGIVWTLNLFNFMDGIDGIAASEAVFIACAGALLASFTGTDSALCAALVLGAACCGFILWNWPPARIFMGDIGSGYLGYIIAVLAIAAARENSVALWVWLILGGVFFVDATMTLTRRLLRREPVYEAHRSHAYQWLARRWGSHWRVTVAVIIVDSIWLFPCAYAAMLYPDHALWIAVGALLPISLICMLAGAGRRESVAKGTDPY